MLDQRAPQSTGRALAYRVALLHSAWWWRFHRLFAVTALLRCPANECEFFKGGAHGTAGFAILGTDVDRRSFAVAPACPRRTDRRWPSARAWRCPRSLNGEARTSTTRRHMAAPTPAALCGMGGGNQAAVVLRQRARHLRS